MSSVRTSLAYAFLNANAITALQFFSSLILARLLSPSEFGVYSTAAVFVGIAQLLREFGVASYVVQAKSITTDLLRAAFTLLLMLAWSIGLILALLSSSIAEFYREPAARDIVLVLALNFFVTPLGAVTMAVAQRNMRFRAIALIGIAGTIVGTVATIFLAMQGYGPISLAWGAVAGTVATFVCTLPLRTAEMSWWPTLHGLKPLLRFGGTVTSSNVLGYVNRSASDIMLGRLINMDAVGLFNRAASMNRYFTSALNGALAPVMLPWLSQLNRAGTSLEDIYEKITERITGLSWPVYAVIALLSDPLIHVLFGDQWRSSAGLVPFICMAAMVSVPYTASGALFLAKGKPANNLLSEAINLPIKVIAILVAAPYGLYAVAVAWPFVALAGAAVQQILLSRVLKVRLMDSGRYLGKSALVTLVVVLATWSGLQTLANEAASIIKLVVGGGISFVVWAATLKLLKHPLYEELLRLVQQLKSRLAPD